MYKLTAIPPPDKIEQVAALLRAESEVSHVLTMRGAVADAEQGVVTAYVRRGATDVVIEHLRTLCQWQPGELSFIEVDLAVHRDLDQLDVEQIEGEDEEDTIGWEMILDLAHSESRLTWWYLVFMACAGLIAAIGLVANVPLLILGAMSLSPDLAPTNAMAITLSAGAWREFFRSLRTLTLGLGVALGVAFLATVFLRITGLRTEALEINEHLLTFVTVISISTVIVALAAGVAAMTAFVTNQATTAVGVAISVTTIPAAAYAGVAMASYSLVEGSDALKVLAVNVFFLIVAQFLMLVILRKWMIRRQMVF